MTQTLKFELTIEFGDGAIDVEHIRRNVVYALDNARLNGAITGDDAPDNHAVPLEIYTLTTDPFSIR